MRFFFGFFFVFFFVFVFSSTRTQIKSTQTEVRATQPLIHPAIVGAAGRLILVVAHVHLKLLLGAAALPVDVVFSSGVARGVSVTFRTSGHRTLWAVGVDRPGLTGFASTTITTSAQLLFANLPASFTTDVPASFDLRAVTLTGALDTGYQGTVAISSSDAQGTNPPNATFVNGVATGMSIRLHQPGTTRIDVQDVAVPTLVGSANVTVAGPILPPAVRVTSPQSGTMLRHSPTLTAEGTSDPRTSVVTLELWVDNALIGSSPSGAVSIIWDTQQVPDGPHTITARVTDAVGGTATSTPVGVTVANGVSTTPDPPAASHGCSATAISPDGLILALLGLLRILAGRKRPIAQGTGAGDSTSTS